MPDVSRAGRADGSDVRGDQRYHDGCLPEMPYGPRRADRVFHVSFLAACELRSTGFSLWILDLARTNPHRLKPVLQKIQEDHVKSIPFLIGILVAIGAGLAAGHARGARSDQAAARPAGRSSQTSARTFPKDVYADTGNRLPAIQRDSLDDTGKKLYDTRGPVDSFGPGAIRLYSLPVSEYMGSVNDFLRHKASLDPRLVELAILVTARESDSEYEWTAHEPQGLKAGLQPEIIDIVRFRKSTDGLAEKDAVIIQLGREVMGKHHVSSDVAARALNLFGRQGLVNIVSLIADYASTAILLNAFDQHIRTTDKPLLPIP